MLKMALVTIRGIDSVRAPRREGRLLHRFLIMAHARRSPSTSSPATLSLARASASPAMPSGPARPFTVDDSVGGCCPVKARTTTLGNAQKSMPEEGDAWEEDAAFGPQVMTAFINYFAKEVRVK